MIEQFARDANGGYITLDFENDVRYYRDIDGNDLEAPRPLTEQEWAYDEELNEPSIDPDRLIEEAMKTRAVLRELLQWLVDNVPGFTAEDRTAIVQAGIAAVEKKRPRP